MARIARWAVLATLWSLVPGVVETASAQDAGPREPTEKVSATLSDFVEADPRIKSFVEQSAGYAVFPSVGKGAFVVGGAHGSGELIQKGRAIGKSEITELSVGLQAGGQSFSEIIFFQTEADVERFTSGKLEFSSGFSAVAVDAGATNKPAYREGVVVFTRTKGGLMAEISVGGQKFKFESY